MTTFEFFKRSYDKMHDYLVKCIREDIEVDSFHFVEVAYNNCWGGTTDIDPYLNINGVDDTREMFDGGYLKYWDFAEYGKTITHISLTKKGLDAFYRVIFQGEELEKLKLNANYWCITKGKPRLNVKCFVGDGVYIIETWSSKQKRKEFRYTDPAEANAKVKEIWSKYSKHEKISTSTMANWDQ